MRTGKRKDVLLAMTPHLPWRSDGVRRFAREVGWNLVDSFRLVGGFGGLAGWRGDGAIVTLRDDPATPAFVRRMRRAGVPVVDLSNQRPDIRVPRVCLDNVGIGRLAARHFAEYNHRHAAWFSTLWMNVPAPDVPGFRRHGDACGRQTPDGVSRNARRDGVRLRLSGAWRRLRPRALGCGRQPLRGRDPGRERADRGGGRDGESPRSRRD